MRLPRASPDEIHPVAHREQNVLHALVLQDAVIERADRLSALFLVVGIAVLFALRGWESWSELFRLSGFAYMLGVAAMGVLFVFELVVGLPLSLAAILLTGAVLVALGAGSGRRAL